MSLQDTCIFPGKKFSVGWLCIRNRKSYKLAGAVSITNSGSPLSGSLVWFILELFIDVSWSWSGQFWGIKAFQLGWGWWSDGSVCGEQGQGTTISRLSRRSTSKWSRLVTSPAGSLFTDDISTPPSLASSSRTPSQPSPPSPPPTCLAQGGRGVGGDGKGVLCRRVVCLFFSKPDTPFLQRPKFDLRKGQHLWMTSDSGNHLQCRHWFCLVERLILLLGSPVVFRWDQFLVIVSRDFDQTVLLITWYWLYVSVLKGCNKKNKHFFLFCDLWAE